MERGRVPKPMLLRFAVPTLICPLQVQNYIHHVLHDSSVESQLQGSPKKGAARPEQLTGVRRSERGTLRGCPQARLALEGGEGQLTLCKLLAK